MRNTEAMTTESILVVEDEAILRESLIAWFSGEGHTVHGAGDGEQALSEFQVEDYDALIIDLKLPGRDGLDVLSEVRKRNPDARVVIVTAYPSYDTAVEAMRRGALDYLPKPFEVERLATSLASVQGPEAAIAPPVEEPLLEEENVAPCIWSQAGVAAERMCTLGYQCNAGCRFHTAMMSSEKYKSDPRIEPYLERLTHLAGTQQCRYVMGGEISSRSCPSLYQCEGCLLGQMLQENVERQLEIKAENKRRKRQAAARGQVDRVAGAAPRPRLVH